MMRGVQQATGRHGDEQRQSQDEGRPQRKQGTLAPVRVI
jgi:hypothetical protein